MYNIILPDTFGKKALYAFHYMELHSQYALFPEQFRSLAIITFLHCSEEEEKGNRIRSDI